MCCFFSVLVFIGPRAAILVWWLIDTDRWEAAFNNFFWAILGFIFAPWTTLTWAAVAPGGVTGFDYFWLALGILIDILSYTGSAYGRQQGYYTTTA
jgi:hypothetical protein